MKNWKLLLGLFGLPFAAIGGFTAFQSFEVLSSAHPSLFAIVMYWPFAVLFSAVGWGLILIAIFGKEVQSGVESAFAQRKRLMGFRTPEEQWRDGRLQTEGKAFVIGGWFGFFVGTVLAAPILWIGFMRGASRGEREYLGWCLASFLPFALATKAVYRMQRWQKFGDSICDVTRRPTLANGELRCLIRPQRATLAGGDAVVHLRCEKRQYAGAGDQRHLTVTILWQESKTVPVQPVGLGIDVSFVIPAEIPDAAPNRNEGVFWGMDVRSAVPGIDYYAEFNLALQRPA